MIKTACSLGIAIFLTAPLFASSGIYEGTSSIALLVALIALAIAIFNTFRIKRVRRIHEVDFMNQKEDFALTLERFKTSITQDSRNPRKEFPRHNNNTKQPINKPSTNPKVAAAPVSADSVVEIKKEVPRNPKPKKKYYHRRKSTGTSGEKNSSLKE